MTCTFSWRIRAEFHLLEDNRIVGISCYVVAVAPPRNRADTFHHILSNLLTDAWWYHLKLVTRWKMINLADTLTFLMTKHNNTGVLLSLKVESGPYVHRVNCNCRQENCCFVFPKITFLVQYVYNFVKWQMTRFEVWSLVNSKR